MKKVHIILASLAVLLIFSCKKEGGHPTGDESRLPPYDVYLCIGASNMAGNTEIHETDTQTLDGVFLLDEDGDLAPASAPMNRYSTIGGNTQQQGLNPAYSFARQMHEFTGRRIIIVCQARNNTKLEQWLKDAPAGRFSQEDNDLEQLWGSPMPQFYAEALRRIRQAQKYGQLKAILWHQGEAEEDVSSLTSYIERLSGLVSDLRSDLSNPTLPFISGEMLRSGQAGIINPILRKIPATIPYSACVDSKGCSGSADNINFDREGQLLLGVRYASITYKAICGTLPPPEEDADTTMIPDQVPNLEEEDSPNDFQ